MLLITKIKSYYRVRCVILILLTFSCISSYAQQAVAVDSTATVVSSNTLLKDKQSSVDFRVPEKNKIREYKNDSRFKYNEPERGLSLWDKIKFWFFNLLNDLLGSVSRTGIPGVIVIIVIVLLICLIILRIAGVDYRKILGKKEIDTPEIDIYTENVHQMNFESLIANALKNKDYRLAVRFLYLKNLKQLSDKEIIDWKANKTNYSYQYEISNSSLRSKFLETTLIFDYIWYGEFPVSENSFEEIQTHMNDLSKMLNNER